MIVARFFVTKVIKQNFGSTETNCQVELKPVIAGEPNTDWSKWTPSGLIELTLTNPFAAAWFDERIGETVAITFDDVPADA